MYIEPLIGTIMYSLTFHIIKNMETDHPNEDWALIRIVMWILSEHVLAENKRKSKLILGLVNIIF